MNEALVENWSDSEILIARQAFDRAQGRAVDALVLAIRSRSQALDGVDSVWALHDFLSTERHIMEGRFDFQLDGILFVFASLVKDQLLEIRELAGLQNDKLAKITAMARF